MVLHEKIPIPTSILLFQRCVAEWGAATLKVLVQVIFDLQQLLRRLQRPVKLRAKRSFVFFAFAAKP
jgi:hypothetical protein